MDTAWMWSWSSLPTLSMNKAVRLFSFYFPNALQGTVTEMCNILVIALSLTPQQLSSDPKAALCACSMLISKRYVGIRIFYIFIVSSCQSGSNSCGWVLIVLRVMCTAVLLYCLHFPCFNLNLIVRKEHWCWIILQSRRLSSILYNCMTTMSWVMETLWLWQKLGNL